MFNSSHRRLLVTLIVAGILLVNIFVAAFPGVPLVRANGILTLKWTRTNTPGGGETVLIADVRPDIAGEEIIYAGVGRVVCLRGTTGTPIWDRSYSGVGDTAQPQMGDIDNDGDLEIVVPRKHPAGLYVLHAENGDTMWSRNLGAGRCDSSSVIADIDGDGYPTIFLAVMAYEEQPSNGWLIAYEYDPGSRTIEERDRVQVWHPCAGGLSIADTDNDGVFELYMGDRDAYYADGGWGRGLRSFWAENLSSRWDRYDWVMSSNIPMPADVDKDGILDIVTINLRGGIAVLNSSDGRPLGGRFGQNLRMPTHYQPSVYDIDGDGNLEILMANGYYAYAGGLDIVIWDLYNWEEDGRITVENGPKLFFGPQIGEVTGDGIMDIIAVSYDDTEYPRSSGVHIYDRNYNLVDEYLGLTYRCVMCSIQDIDDDDLNEIVVASQGGTIYAFDTPGIAAIPRARSEVQFYSYRRLGVSEYVPVERPWPDVLSPSPSNGQKGVSTSLSELSFNLSHPEGIPMSYTVTTDPDILDGSGTGGPVGDGRYSVSVDELALSTTYTWHLNVTDGEHWTNKTFTFTTGPYQPNRLPTHLDPELSPASATFRDDLICFNQSTEDLDGDEVTNIYNWYRDGVSFTNLLLPFDTKTSADDEYSGYAVTRDYSGYDNDGTVFGATWTGEGVVGGAYTFGGNDFIRVEENDASLGGDGSWSEMSIEFWVKATTNTGTKRLIWKHDRYNYSMGGWGDAEPYGIGYQIDFSATGSSNTVTWYVYTPSQLQLTYSIEENARAWHHVVCTYESGSGLRIYVDGVEVASLSGSGNIQKTNRSGDWTKRGPLDIGFQSGNDFRGMLDEVRIYPQSLSPFQASKRYNEAKDGLSNNSTIAWQETELGDYWWCEVTPNDSFGDGTSEPSNILHIVEDGNTAPEASNLEITPASPLPTDTLTATYTYTDADGDPEYGSEIKWYKDGELQSELTYSSTVSPDLTAKYQVWHFTVRPRDGIEFGAEETSPPVTIQNAPPSFTGVYITPDPAFNTSTLTANPYGWFDVDGDPEGYEYQWQKLDGSWLDIVGETSQTLIPTHFARGDHIRVQCTAWDGEDYGTTLLDTAWIVDSDPPTHDNPLLVSSHEEEMICYSDEDLICYNQTTTDPDLDEKVTNIYHWKRDGDSLTNLLMPLNTNSSVTAKDYSGYDNDGTVFGASWTSDGVVGGAYTFDGNDYIRIEENDGSLGGDGSWSEISIEFWVKIFEPDRLIWKHDREEYTYERWWGAGNGIGYMIDFSGAWGSSTVTWSVFTSDSDELPFGEVPLYYPFSVSYDIMEDAWHHVVCTYESGPGVKMYVDGVEVASYPATGDILPTVDGPLDIAYESSFGGVLDEVRIYPETRTPAQIFQRYIDTKGGLSNSSTIVAQETTAGEEWSCDVIPNDSWQDGDAKTSNTLLVLPAGENSRPRIDLFTPSDTTPEVNEGESLEFTHISSDPDDDPLFYSWLLDHAEQTTTQNWTYSPGFGDAGPHNITLVVSDFGGLSDSQEWTVTVMGSPVTCEVTFLTDPVGPGFNITYQGTTYNDSDTDTFPYGTSGSATADCPEGYVFDHWEATGNVEVIGSTVTITCGGTLKAVFSPVLCEVTFLTDPVGPGFNITYQGETYLDGESDTFSYGTSGLATADAPVDYVFDHWVATGNVEVIGSTVTITCGGTLKAVFSPVETIVYLDPSEVVGPPPAVGDNFTLTLRIGAVENLYAWTVNITWDPTILEFVSVSEGNCLKSNLGGSTMFLPGTVTPGKIEDMMCTVLGPPDTNYVDVPPAPNGLVNITFTVLDYTGPAGTWINITGSRLASSFPGIDILHTVGNAKLTLIPCDLVISEVELPYAEAVLYANITYDIGVNVTNLGASSASAFSVSLELYWVDGGTVEYYQKETVAGLGPGESTVVHFSVEITRAGDYVLNATADCNDDVAESSEANNSMVITVDGRLTGDLDGDGDVDFDDIVAIAMAYGSKRGDPNYNEQADLDADGDVDFDDIVTAAMNYGKSLPP